MDDGTARVVPVGELDQSTVSLVNARVRAAIEDGCRHLVVDLSRPEFLDSSGVHLLLSWRDAADAGGWQMTIVPGPGPIQRVFDLLGLTETLPFAVDSR